MSRLIQLSFVPLALAALFALPSAGCEEFTGTGTSSAGGAATQTTTSSDSSSASNGSTSTTTPTTTASSSTGGCPGGCDDGVNATGECMGDVCKYTCDPDFGDCDSDPKTCEVELTTDEQCGACDTACATHCALIDAKHQCNDPIHVTAGKEHTCAIRRDGTVWCWGFNNFGQAGVGGLVSSQYTPAPIMLPFKAKQISARHYATCALGEGGELACWGRDGTNASKPLVYPTLVGSTSVAVGGLDPSDNGPGDSLRLTTAFHTRRFVVSNTAEPLDSLLLQAQVEVAAGGGHHCMRNTLGEVRCAGANGKSQLGIGSTSTYELTPILVSGLTAKTVALGARHSCAIRSDDKVSCWGDNNYLQIGLTDIDPSFNVPKLITIPGNPAVTAISLGEDHSSAIAGGTLFLWGRNNYNQASQTATNPVNSPAAYPLADVVEAALGGSHTCAIVSDGRLLCWGANFSHQLGDGSPMLNPPPSPTPIEPLWP